MSVNPLPRHKGLFKFEEFFKGRFPIPNHKDIKHCAEFYAGDTITLEVQVCDECDYPFDITDWTIYWTVKAEEWDLEVLYQINSIDDPKLVVKTNPTLGVLQVTMQPSVSRLLDVGQYIFDIQLSKANEDPELEPIVKTVLRAWFILKRDVTGYTDPTP